MKCEERILNEMLKVFETFLCFVVFVLLWEEVLEMVEWRRWKEVDE
jgi:hypothetical protein